MFTTLLRQMGAGLRLLLVMTVLLGLAYPALVYGVSRLPGLHDRAEGSLLRAEDGTVVGSSLIGIDPVAADAGADPWFHTRPSASSDDVLGPGDPSVSGGSNLAGDSADLLAAVTERRELIADREDVRPDEVPADAVTASGSGVDPHISPAYAALQAPRVARVTGLDEDRVRELIAEHTDGRVLGVLGGIGVNTTELNLAVSTETARRASGG